MDQTSVYQSLVDLSQAGNKKGENGMRFRAGARKRGPVQNPGGTLLCRPLMFTQSLPLQ